MRKPVCSKLSIAVETDRTGHADDLDESLLRASTHRESGFIAQEVEQAAASAGFIFSGVDKPIHNEALFGLRYGDFVVPLVKAVQELTAMNQELFSKNNTQTLINATLANENENLTRRIEKLELLIGAKEQ
jgi:hypothetical protein